MKIIRNNKGNSILTTPLIIAISLIMISSLIVFSVNILTPYILYEKLSATCIKYIFVMEEYGYLTNKEKESLIKELTKQGFEIKNINIKYTSKRQNYGSPIYLKIDYDYELKLPVVGTKTVPMNIYRESVSKR